MSACTRIKYNQYIRRAFWVDVHKETDMMIDEVDGQIKNQDILLYIYCYFLLSEQIKNINLICHNR